MPKLKVQQPEFDPGTGRISFKPGNSTLKALSDLSVVTGDSVSFIIRTAVEIGIGSLNQRHAAAIVKIQQAR